MKKIIPFLVFAVSISCFAQKVKIKKGKVYVDKVVKLHTETTKLGTVYKTLDGKNLFRFERDEVFQKNPNKNVSNSINKDAELRYQQEANQSDPIRRGDRYEKPKKTKFYIVSFYDLKLEFETTLSSSKIIKEFYKTGVITDDGLVIPVRAKLVAKSMAKDISGKRKYN